MTLLDAPLLVSCNPDNRFVLYNDLYNIPKLQKSMQARQMRDSLVSASDAASEYVMGALKKPRILLEALADVFSNGMFDNEAENLNVFTNLTKSYTDSTGFYGYMKDVYYDGTGWVPDADWDPVKRPWYTGAVADPAILSIQTFMLTTRPAVPS